MFMIPNCVHDSQSIHSHKKRNKMLMDAFNVIPALDYCKLVIFFFSVSYERKEEKF